MASTSCHMESGCSGLPKLRQSVTASGRAPVVATLRYASARASCAPVYGSSLAYRPLASVASATPRPVVSSTRITPESSGCASAVLPCTNRSYWLVTQALDARFGLPSSCRTVARSSALVDGRSRDAAVSAFKPSCHAGRAVVDGAVVRDGPRLDVDDALAVVVDGQATGAGDLADHRGLDVPLAGDGQERVELVGPDHGHHPLLRLRHEDLAGRERGVAQQHVLEVDVHAAVAVRRQLAGGARDAGGAQ